MTENEKKLFKFLAIVVREIADKLDPEYTFTPEFYGVLLDSEDIVEGMNQEAKP